MMKRIYEKSAFTLMELLIVLFIAGALSAAVISTVFSYRNNADLEASCERLFSDLAEAQLCALSGNAGSMGFVIEFLPSASPWVVNPSDTGYMFLGGLTSYGSDFCGTLSIYKYRNNDPGVVPVIDDTSFNVNVALASDSELINGNFIIYTNDRRILFASGCGVAPLPMTTANNEIVLQYLNTNLKKVIHISPTTGRLTINASKID